MSPLRTFLGLLFLPFSYTIVCFAASGVFYYVFLLFFKRQIEYKHIYFIVMMSGLSVMLFNVVSPLLPVLQLLGLAGSGVLLTLGFSQSFQLPRKELTIIMVILFSLYSISGLTQFSSWKMREESRNVIKTPKSLDILEQEFGKSNEK